MTDGALGAQHRAEAAHRFLSKYSREGERRGAPAQRDPLPNGEEEQQQEGLVLLRINHRVGESQMF